MISKDYEIHAFLVDALRREKLEVDHLIRVSSKDEFVELMFSIMEDFRVLADRCNVMVQDYLSIDEGKENVGDSSAPLQ